MLKELKRTDWHRFGGTGDISDVGKRVLRDDGGGAQQQAEDDDETRSLQLVGCHTDDGDDERGEDTLGQEDESDLVGGKAEMLVEERSVEKHAVGTC